MSVGVSCVKKHFQVFYQNVVKLGRSRRRCDSKLIRSKCSIARTIKKPEHEAKAPIIWCDLDLDKVADGDLISVEDN